LKYNTSRRYENKADTKLKMNEYICIVIIVAVTSLLTIEATATLNISQS